MDYRTNTMDKKLYTLYTNVPAYFAKLSPFLAKYTQGYELVMKAINAGEQYIPVKWYDMGGDFVEDEASASHFENSEYVRDHLYFWAAGSIDWDKEYQLRNNEGNVVFTTKNYKPIHKY